MTFLLNEITIPVWLLVLLIVIQIPSFYMIIRWFKRDASGQSTGFTLGGFNTTRVVKIKSDNDKKDKSASKSKRPTEVRLLKILASKGDQGMLIRSMADGLQIDSNSVKKALTFLEGKNLVEMVTGITGDKYFLTQQGKSYCSKKGYTKVA